MKHLADKARHRATKRTAQVLPALVMTFEIEVSWLRGRYSPDLSALCIASRRPYFRRLNGRHFRGQNVETSPYRQADGLLAATLGLSAAAPLVWHRLFNSLPASDYSPLIVELFTPRDLPWSPKQSRSGMACYQAHGSRRRPYVERPQREANPADGFGRMKCNHTILKTDGLPKNTLARISVSPRIGARKEQHTIG